ncbi:MAG: hypothetical protein N4A64_14695 [Marinisporobacter sp.]|jgi:hypothetical protein|nr:hypothetical protein [Marinisporobacter sp.]
MLLFLHVFIEVEVKLKVMSINNKMLTILTLVLYYMDLKGIYLEVKIKNELLTNIFMYSSIVIGILATISIIFEFSFFENKIGFIRYDELILCVNAIVVAMMIPLLPTRENTNHKEYKRIKKEMDKQFNMMCAIYCSIMIYQKVI